MLDGQTCLVTGASRGIGRVIAEQMAEAGANVALAARSDGIEETADRIDAPDRTLTVRMDVTDEESVKEGIRATVDRFDGLDCVVNNAGVTGPTAPVESTSRADWEDTFEVNTIGVFLVSKHAIEPLRHSSRGSIVNISSITGKRTRPQRSPYAASKMAVVGFTRTLAEEVGPDDITANTICPGAAESERIDRLMREKAEEMGITAEEAKQRILADKTMLGRIIQPDDVANLAVFLASDFGRNITGQDINVDSGTIYF